MKLFFLYFPYYSTFASNWKWQFQVDCECPSLCLKCQEGLNTLQIELFFLIIKVLLFSVEIGYN